MYPIIVRSVIQIIGSPQMHVENTLQRYVENLKKDKSFEVVKTTFATPVEQDNLFSAYVEIELRAKDTAHLVSFCFDYMPASIEILEPSKLSYEREEFSGFLNDLQARLHKLDLLVKNLHAENKILKQNTMTLIKNIIKISLRESDKTLPELSKLSGMPEVQIKKFAAVLVKEGKVKETKGTYHLL